MKNKFLFSAVLLITASFFSCTEEHDHGDHDAPVISITSPAGSAMFMNNDTIHITGMVTENDDLHELLVEIRKPDHTVLFSQAPTVHGLDTFLLDMVYPVTGMTSASDAQLVVIASDHSENIDSVVVNLELMP